MYYIFCAFAPCKTNFLFSEIHLSDLRLSPGTQYFSKLTVCNSAGMCNNAISDGVIPDNTPPVAGSITDGLGPEDIEWQRHM